MTKSPFQHSTEQFIFQLCRKTFLSLWSYPNPRASGRKELCDVLVLCDPDVIVISVKDCGLSSTASPELAAQRWYREAIEKSVKQLYGACRWLSRYSGNVIKSDGSLGLPLPPLDRRRVHRISVSLGSAGLIPIPIGDFGKGFVHVLSGDALGILIEQLDTISDFVHYLSAKEALASQVHELMIHGEENLLAVYLRNDRSFPDGMPSVIPDGLWGVFSASETFQRKLVADRPSYAWDRLVENWGSQALARELVSDNELSEDEQAFRIMARENRFSRRVLAGAFLEFYEAALAGKLRSRIVPSPQGGAYVFLNARPEDERDERVKELSLRCVVARGKTACNPIVGICLNVKPAAQGHCEDICLLEIPEWTPEHAAHADQISTNLGYFANPETSSRRIDEYPPEED